MFVSVVVAASGAAVLAGCSSDAQPQDELMLSANPVAATAARSPAPTATPAGTVVPLAGNATAMAVDLKSRRLAVAVEAPPSVLLYNLDALDQAPRTVALPGPTDSLAAADGALVASVDGSRSLVRISLPDGAPESTQLDGAPAGTTAHQGRTLVALRDRKGVAVLDGGAEQRLITGGLLSADQVYSTGAGAVVLDRLRNAVFQLDVGAGSVSQGLRAGEGATNGAVDRYGRILVTDTRGGALLAFSLDPLLMRQRYPVPGAPYGIAVDPGRDLAWVTLTERNEVVGYDVAGGEPRERYRFPTVGQPDSVAVDPTSGRVLVASASGGGVQVVQP